MTRDLWLTGVEYLDVEADTNLIVSHEVNQSEAGTVGERFEKQFYVVPFASHFCVDLLV